MTPPALDPRVDTPTPDAHEAVTRSVNSDVVRMLEGISRSMEIQATQVQEIRASQKSTDIKLDALSISHGDHRKSLDRVADEVVALGKRVTANETAIADSKAANTETRRRLSDTQAAFESTLAAVNASTTRIAEKTESVAGENATQTTQLTKLAEKTEAVKTAADVHTSQLNQLAISTDTQTAILETAKRWLPIFLLVATALGASAGDLVHAFLTHFHGAP